VYQDISAAWRRPVSTPGAALGAAANEGVGHSTSIQIGPGLAICVVAAFAAVALR
jgi:hypothetical protein